MTDAVQIGLVLPDVMGTYGDGGNAVVLRQRLRLRGIAAEIVPITLSEPVPESLDLYTLGGAEDYAQRLATRHLLQYPGLQRAAGRGAPVLAICAAIQVLGHWYETSAGERVDGVSLLDVTTSPQPERTIGEVVSTPLIEGLSESLTGFENHRGGTVLGPDARPLAAVSKGAGNRLGAGQRVRNLPARAVSGPQPRTGRLAAVESGRAAGAAGAARGDPVAPRAPGRAAPDVDRRNHRSAETDQRALCTATATIAVLAGRQDQESNADTAN